MTSRTLSTALRAATILVAVGTLSACNALSRMSEIGSGPQLSKIENPTQKHGYQSVSLPMPQASPPPQNANSLWRPGSRAFFKDQRAKEIGDILTVAVSIDESASLNATLTRSRNAAETDGITSMLGFENSLKKILPDSVVPSTLVGATGVSSNTNSGTTARTETMTANLAAVITQVLPNGNLVISGKQEIRVNYELRELSIQGIIRPEDISSSNSVTYDKIAEARISLGGRGINSDLTQPRYGQQILDVILPF
ncbi:flagellar basal body L-ring protein FlgH [Magnetospirillum moscoviense]|uniref:Flagellar L-ring protein n=1 Tax=Magnetospirillum moscoviense TaxID=1437059 RepID=A0A178MCG6_9PROT|nr:flagellar basal body L-ring protein FlgH [Magnetospirillum moscoviense]MBF0327453.1 flagellar basal body L-ring protein FlgH [Alphaproteobacteria bacterium]OAN46226.1 flagellar basal body L-ring protein [Magnetospirillum moscoviense]